ncbi:MAG: MATE family efflux transporter [Eubacteriales bacterium]|nr:MATE family efflux transporter [Eubacteriales bacterium]
MEQCAVAQRPMFTPVALRRLIIPLILEQFLAMTVGLAATIMITHVSEAAVSGVSLVDAINNLFINILAALCTGGAIVCAQYLGRRDSEHARLSARQLFYIALIFSVTIGAVFLAAPRFFVRIIFGAVDADVMKSATTYLTFSALSYPFLAVYNACAALFRSMGNSRVSLLASLVMNVVNVAINAILIYVFQFGVVGAGIATLVSRAVAAVITLFLIRNQHNPVYLKGLHRVSFDGRLIRSILSVGIPTGFENGLFNFGRLVVQTLIVSLGTAALAANAIIGSISNMAIVPGLGMGLAIVTVFGQCVGAGDYEQAVSYLKKMMLYTVVSMASVNIPLFLFSRQIVGLFPLDPSVMEESAQVLRFLGISGVLFWPLSFAFPNALRAAGDARFTMVVSASSMWFVRFGLSYLFIKVLGMGFAGVWYGMMIDWIFRCFFFIFRYRSGKWKTKCVIR